MVRSVLGAISSFRDAAAEAPSGHGSGAHPKLPPFLKLTNTDPFVAWCVVTGDATPDDIRVVRSVLGAISSFRDAAAEAPSGHGSGEHHPRERVLY